MGGIYGTTLPIFAEQFSSLCYFNMAPTIDDGYGPIIWVSGIRGIIRSYSAPPTAEGQKIRMAEGNLVTQKAPFLWTELRLNLGWFIADTMLTSGSNIVASATNVYRIMTDNLFDDTAGVVVQGLNKLVGNNGLVASSLNFTFGSGLFI